MINQVYSYIGDKKIVGLIISALSVFLALLSSYESNLRNEMLETNIYLNDLHIYYQGKKNRASQTDLFDKIIRALDRDKPKSLTVIPDNSAGIITSDNFDYIPTSIKDLTKINQQAIFNLAVITEEKRASKSKMVKLIEISKSLLQIGIFLISIFITLDNRKILFCAIFTILSSLIIFSTSLLN